MIKRIKYLQTHTHPCQQPKLSMGVEATFKVNTTILVLYLTIIFTVLLIPFKGVWSMHLSRRSLLCLNMILKSRLVFKIIRLCHIFVKAISSCFQMLKKKWWRADTALLLVLMRTPPGTNRSSRKNQQTLSSMVPWSTLTFSSQRPRNLTK